MTLRLNWNILMGLGALLAIVYLVVCFALYFYQNRLIFFPSPVLENVPGDFNLPHEDVWIPVGDGEQSIHSWWIPAAGEGVVLHLHGNGYNVGANLSQALQFHRMNLSVLMIDYRGYGLSQGNFPTEASVYQDAAAAWNYLTQMRRIPASRIVVFGHSLGGAIAINLVSQSAQAAGLIVQSSFTSMREMVNEMGRFWMLPIELLLTHQFDSIGKVSALKLPVLYTHGTADTIIPYKMSQALYAATPQPKTLLLVPGAGHNDVSDAGGNHYFQTCQGFIAKALASAQL